MPDYTNPNTGGVPVRISLVAQTEQMAANGWPAIVNQHLEGWRLRASNGVSRRGNSVLPLGSVPGYKGWMDEVTAFYRRQNLPVRFQMSPGCPPELDRMLVDMGYRIDAPTAVQAVPAAIMLPRLGEKKGEFELVASEHLTDGWLDSFLRVEGISPEKRATYERILAGTGVRSCFVQLRLEGDTVGVGRATAERGWGCLFSVATAREHRRTGIATEIMRALGEWCWQVRAERLFLQVMADNEPALRLYARLGFEHLYYYYFRTE